jgi:hypothetical protein
MFHSLRNGLLTAVVMILPVSTARCDEDGWRLEKDKDGIQVYTRAVPGWSIREFKGVTQIHAGLKSLVAVINDIPASRELTEGLIEAEVRERESDVRFKIYSAMKMPWPIADRDILNQREIQQDKNTFCVTITDTGVQDPPGPKRGFVRITNSHQVWTLRPIAWHEVYVETRTLADPAGPIPARLINIMAIGVPFKTLKKLNEMVERAQYTHPDLRYIEEMPTGRP